MFLSLKFVGNKQIGIRSSIYPIKSYVLKEPADSLFIPQAHRCVPTVLNIFAALHRYFMLSEL
jgi:hypothetical protein